MLPGLGYRYKMDKNKTGIILKKRFHTQIIHDYIHIFWHVLEKKKIFFNCVKVIITFWIFAFLDLKKNPPEPRQVSNSQCKVVQTPACQVNHNTGYPA